MPGHYSAPMASKSPVTLVWLRRDLRVADQPALTAALKAGPTLAVYILDTDPAEPHKLGGASRWWLHHSLASLTDDLAKLGVPLVLRQGQPLAELKKLVKETGATALHYGRLYDSYGRTVQEQVVDELPVEVTGHNTMLLHEPWELATKGGTPFKVYGAFTRTAAAAPLGKALPAPRQQAHAPKAPRSDRLDSWHLLPTHPDWAKGFAVWQPGSAAGHKRLKHVAAKVLARYDTGRNLPAEDLSSRLSPYLTFGELSPRQIWHATGASSTYRKELLWREFATHLLWHNPQMPDAPLDPKFKAFPYRTDIKALHAWQQGRTGYPIVDAGIRQLWQTGWMHNRVRLIAASFLIKHLLLRWQKGEDWFLDTLVDADLANNAMNWQWVAGCGADAAPYFRIFNPILQSKKFKAQDYIREFVPELAKLPDRHIHAPWQAPVEVLEKAGVTLGKNYPQPIVDHDAARARALAAFQVMRKAAHTATSSPAPKVHKPKRAKARAA